MRKMYCLHNLGLLVLLVKRMTLRHWFKAPKQTLLQILILSLGVSVFFSIRLANRAAITSFEHFTTLLHQESDYQIKAPTGELSTTLLYELRRSLDTMPVEIIPVLDITTVPPPTQDQPIGSRPLFELLGLDLIALQNLRSPQDLQDMPSTREVDKERELGLFVTHTLALQRHLHIGDRFPLVIDDAVVEFRIAGWIPEVASHPRLSSHLLMVDLPTLQHLKQFEGKISRIEFLLPEGPSREANKKLLFKRLKAIAQGRWEIGTARDRGGKAALMTRPFRMNLTILSLIALLAGLYLIFQALDGAVVRRRGEIAVLRSLGITEAIIQYHWLIEALLLGICGGILGSLLGWAAAQLAVRSIAAIVSALYYTTTVDSANLDLREFLLAMMLSVSSALLTGWWPARQAAAVPPAQILSLENDKNAPRSPFQSIGIGLFFLLLSGLLSLAPAVTFFNHTPLPLGGYFATLLLILAGGIFCGYFTEHLGSFVSFFGKFSVGVKLASSHLYPLSKRHHLAASGILCGLTMAAGMLILIASFEQTMQRWIAATFQADLYISSADCQGTSVHHPLSRQSYERITGDQRIADVQVISSRDIILHKLDTTITGIDIDFLKRHQNILWKKAPRNDDFFNEEKNSHLVLASESFAERFQVRRGEHVIIPTPSGDQEMTIVGIFSDYGNERGSLTLDRRHFSKYFHDDLVTILMVMLKVGVDPEELQLQFSSQFPALSILSNRHLREEILRIFHQTFSITYALELIGIVIAIIGLGMTLSNILIDRTRELTTLRALGCTYRIIAIATALEGGLLAIGGVVLGTLVSLGIGYILIYVINKQSFGWTLQFAIPYLPLALLGVTVIASGFLVAYVVGRMNSNLKADLHE